MRDRADDLHRLDQPEVRPCGRSIVVMSPVMTAFAPNPSRVRNILILLGRRVLRFVEDDERVLSVRRA